MCEGTRLSTSRARRSDARSFGHEACSLRPPMNKHANRVVVATMALFIAAACGGTRAGDTSGPDSGDASGHFVDGAASSSDSGRPDATHRDAGVADDARSRVDSRPIVDAYPPDDVISRPGFLACNVDPPAGAPQAAPFPTYAGTCPTLMAAAPSVEGGAPIPNTIMSSGNARQFLLAVPSDLMPDEKLPIVFMWHWLKGSDVDFYNTGEVQSAVDQQRFLAVMPQSKGDLLWEWPFAISDGATRLAEEVQFFDDMLACVSAAYPTSNRNCVSSAGVSAGALFTDQLGSIRADHLSSILSMSGGVGGLVRPWGNPAHVLPVLVLWGGPKDLCALNFQTESQNLETSLEADGNFILECVHNCGHSAPPVVPAPGMSTYASMWSFLFDHPYWLAPGQSPYLTTGLPSDYPSWCAIGAGKATIRTGPCNGTSC